MRRALLLSIPLLLSCTAEVEGELPTHDVVLTTLSFARAADGVSVGFDLDGRTSSSDDPEGCGKADFVSPEGDAGIDNATSGLMGLLELTEAVAVEPLIQQTINSGELLVAMELVGLDDPLNDDSVDVWLWQALGSPYIGNDGRIEPGQTLERDLSLDPSIVQDVAVVDGVLEARGFNMRLPIQIFDAAIDLTIENAALRLNIDPDGAHHGVLAGAFQWDGLLATLSMAAIDPSLQDSLPSLFSSMSDMQDEQGVCRVMSATLAFDATDSFFFDDAAE
mgnify:CR=1 FL=1